MGVSPHVTTINLGRRSPGRLDATYPHTPGAPSTCAYLVLLRVEIARFTQIGPCPIWVTVSLKLALEPSGLRHPSSAFAEAPQNTRRGV